MQNHHRRLQEIRPDIEVITQSTARLSVQLGNLIEEEQDLVNSQSQNTAQKRPTYIQTPSRITSVRSLHIPTRSPSGERKKSFKQEVRNVQHTYRPSTSTNSCRLPGPYAHQHLISFTIYYIEESSTNCSPTKTATNRRLVS